MKIQEHVALAPLTTFKVGGAARYFVEAQTEQDVTEAVRFARERGLPLFVLGGGSNLVVSDSGWDGLVLRIALRGIEQANQGDKVIFEAGAGGGESGGDAAAAGVRGGCAVLRRGR